MPPTMWDVLCYECPICKEEDFDSAHDIAVHEGDHDRRNEVQGDPFPGLDLISPEGDVGRITSVEGDTITVHWWDTDEVGTVNRNDRFIVDI